jgi:hypothetical protein
MISHRYKCIFIHIPRTCGSFIEKYVFKEYVSEQEKHLTSDLAKQHYNQYWDDYAKFTIVRDPWARIYSLIKLDQNYANCNMIDGKIIDIEGYMSRFTFNGIPIEIDHRYNTITNNIQANYKKSMMYTNFIGEEMDYVLDYDNLADQLPLLLDQLEIDFDMSNIKRPSKKYDQFFTTESRNQVLSLHEAELDKYNLQFGAGKLNDL